MRKKLLTSPLSNPTKTQHPTKVIVNFVNDRECERTGKIFCGGIGPTYLHLHF
jgi:hypothetical protein